MRSFGRIRVSSRNTNLPVLLMLLEGACLGSESTEAGIRYSGLCTFESITEAQSRVVDDLNGRMERSTQHVLESGLDIHGQHGISSVAFY